MSNINNKFGTTEYPNQIKRQGDFPLEKYSVFETYEEAEDYAANSPIAYEGQQIVVKEDINNNNNPTLYILKKASEGSIVNYILVYSSETDKLIDNLNALEERVSNNEDAIQNLSIPQILCGENIPETLPNNSLFFKAEVPPPNPFELMGNILFNFKQDCFTTETFCRKISIPDQCVEMFEYETNPYKEDYDGSYLVHKQPIEFDKSSYTFDLNETITLNVYYDTKWILTFNDVSKGETIISISKDEWNNKKYIEYFNSFYGKPVENVVNKEYTKLWAGPMSIMNFDYVKSLKIYKKLDIECEYDKITHSLNNAYNYIAEYTGTNTSNVFTFKFEHDIYELNESNVVYLYMYRTVDYPEEYYTYLTLTSELVNKWNYKLIKILNDDNGYNIEGDYTF